MAVSCVSGLGSTACCFLGPADVSDQPGEDKNRAGGGGKGEAGREGEQIIFICKNPTHPAGPERPNEPNQQPGIHFVPSVTPHKFFSTHPFIPPKKEEVTSVQIQHFLSLSVELHTQLLDQAHFSFCHRKQVQNSHNTVGPPTGGLHHSERSRPLPHQAGKRLPAAGFKTTNDSALREIS